MISPLANEGLYLNLQLYYRRKYWEAKCEANWNEMGKHVTPSGLGVGLEPPEWWKKGVYITPERVDSYIANLSLPTVGPGGMKKRKVSPQNRGVHRHVSRFALCFQGFKFPPFIPDSVSKKATCLSI